MIDWSIRAGDILVMSSFCGTCLYYAYKSGRFAESIETMQKQITELKEVSKSMLVIITEQAVQTVRLDAQAERLNSIDTKIENIRRGERLTTSPHR